MTGRRGGWRRWGAVLAAYLVVLQATLTGLTLGAHAAPAPGAFAEILCSSADALRDASDAPADRRGPPNCCVLGCSMLGGGAAPVPETAFAAPRIDAEPTAAVAPRFLAASRSPDPSPRTTRAPPAA